MTNERRPKPPKNALEEAATLKAALDKIYARELAVIKKANSRAQEMRTNLYNAASPAALAALDAAEKAEA